MKYLVIKPEEYQQAINECERLAKENEELKTSLNHAAEVLAKRTYELKNRKSWIEQMRQASPNGISQAHAQINSPYYILGDWSKATQEERQKEINEAKELLK